MWGLEANEGMSGEESKEINWPWEDNGSGLVISRFHIFNWTDIIFIICEIEFEREQKIQKKLNYLEEAMIERRAATSSEMAERLP